MNETVPPNELTFNQFRKRYIKELTLTKSKSPLTILKEESALKRWKGVFGKTPIRNIRAYDIQQYALRRSEAGVSPRTINLDVLALKNMLEYALRFEFISGPLPTDKYVPLKYVPARRSLITDDQLQAIVTEALRHENNDPVYPGGTRLVDLIYFMAYSGARRQAALTAKWENVDYANQQITIFTKFDKKVVVDMNPKLENLLRGMETDRPINGNRSIWLFPSPTREGHWINPGPLKDRIAKSAGVPNFRFHDLRHYFISHCIMAGIDTLTVAAWVGHSDGGVLIGKVYGHLNPAHRRAAAAKVTF